MKRQFPLFLVAVLVACVSAARGAEVAVDLKNDDAQAVSVPLGSDNGVTRESDFLVAADNLSVSIYPVELFEKRFWSQPLSPDAYGRIAAGMAVRPATLDKGAHAAIRKEGQARKAEIKARQDEARREERGKKIEELRARRERLASQRDAMDEKIANAEKDLSDEEGRMDWLTSSSDDDIDRSLQTIQDLADRRDELQAQRDALSRSSRGDYGRLTAEIKRLNDRISSERDTIRNARERKRSARSSYISRKQDWQKLVAERKRLDGEIGSTDRQIRSLSGK